MSQTPALKEQSHREVRLSEYMNTVGESSLGPEPRPTLQNIMVLATWLSLA